MNVAFICSYLLRTQNHKLNVIFFFFNYINSVYIKALSPRAIFKRGFSVCFVDLSLKLREE